MAMSSSMTSASLSFTQLKAIPLMVQRCRNGASRQVLLTAAQRKAALKTLLRLTTENATEIAEAIHADLHKHRYEAELMELSSVRSEINHFLEYLDTYMQPEVVEVEGIMRIEDITIHKDPLGVVLVISPWNYPFLLSMNPIAGALAAGNCVVLKPSELSVNTSAVITKLIQKYFDPEILSVVNGGPSETTQLLAERFDHICYTGNTMVGKIVMEAAAKHATPVLLELGGKSPTIVDGSCRGNSGFLHNIAKRILWGRFVNAGQTCVAPDYIMVHESVKADLIAAMRVAYKELFGEGDPESCESYARIINDRHYQRITKLIDGAGEEGTSPSAKRTIVLGGNRNPSTRFIDITVIDNVSLEEPIMKEEIFGPVLPLMTYTTEDDVISYINQNEKPLALYVFSTNSKFIKTIEKRTSSGSLVVNDVLMQVGIDGVPFGGVGNSGLGWYHGKYSFNTFSHQKVVMKRKAGLEIVNRIRYPPYTDQKLKLALFATERTRQSNWAEKYVLTKRNFVVAIIFLIGFSCGFIAHSY